MKLILSRKGFDSSAGKVPSPILPDGTLLSLPIPDKHSPISYEEIKGLDDKSIGCLVNQLTKGKIPPGYRAHLDPDLRKGSLSRRKGWMPVFGQGGAAQSHLRNRGVGPGDIFLFFGRFRRVEQSGEVYQYQRGTRPIHLIFGWMQVGKVVKVDQSTAAEMPWLQYHPHLARPVGGNNTLYVSSVQLALPGRSRMNCPGAGSFEKYEQRLRLTASQASGCSMWRLPEWFYPAQRASSLSYHRKLDSWQIDDDGVLLQTVAKGQEFVLDCDDYPEAPDWVADTILSKKR